MGADVVTVPFKVIEQLVKPAERTDDNKLVLLPHISLQPIEVEKIKEFID